VFLLSAMCTFPKPHILQSWAIISSFINIKCINISTEMSNHYGIYYHSFLKFH
jgi:hypothetical protein